MTPAQDWKEFPTDLDNDCQEISEMIHDDLKWNQNNIVTRIKQKDSIIHEILEQAFHGQNIFRKNEDHDENHDGNKGFLHWATKNGDDAKFGDVRKLFTEDCKAELSAEEIEIKL